MEFDSLLEVLQKNNQLNEACVTVSKHFCEGCSTCCQKLPIHVSFGEVSRIAKKLQKNEKLVIKQYFKQFDDEYVIKPPCPFLKKGTCEVYEVRPESCKVYPFNLDGLIIDGLIYYVPALNIPEYCNCAKKLEDNLTNFNEDDEFLKETMKVIDIGVTTDLNEIKEKDSKETKKKLEKLFNKDLSGNLGRYTHVERNKLVNLASRIKSPDF